MPCSFHIKRISAFSFPFEDLDTGCQFNVSEDLLIEFEKKTWCPFHLPAAGTDNQPSEKAHWNEEQVSSLNEKLHAFAKERSHRSKVIDLSGIVLPGAISFAGHTFGKGVSFDRAIFESDVLFDDVRFKGTASFYGATFRTVSFEGADFASSADFRLAKFEGEARFRKAKFNGQASFRWASFVKDVTFAKVGFGGDADFLGAKFGAEADFEEAIFDRNAQFDDSHFLGFAQFRRAVFTGEAWFPNTLFNGTAWFIASQFSGGARFDRAKFKGNADFSGSAATASKSGAIRLAEGPANVFFWVNFSKAEFYKRAQFTNRRFLGTTIFCCTLFTLAPEFHNCSLHQDTDFTGAMFPDRTGTGEVHAARAYRTLKLAMENVRNRAEEANFYTLEQQSLRLSPDTSIWVKGVSWLYEKTANYGESFVRPLACILAAFVLFHLIYFGYFAVLTGDALSIWEITMRFTLRQLFHPFKVFGQNFEEIGLSQSACPVPLGLAVTAALHSLLNISFLALILVALRRRFKME